MSSNSKFSSFVTTSNETVKCWLKEIIINNKFRIILIMNILRQYSFCPILHFMLSLVTIQMLYHRLHDWLTIFFFILMYFMRDSSCIMISMKKREIACQLVGLNFCTGLTHKGILTFLTVDAVSETSYLLNKANPSLSEFYACRV